MTTTLITIQAATEGKSLMKVSINIPTVAKGTTWQGAYWEMEEDFDMLIEVPKTAERLAKDAETVVRLKRAYERYGASVGESVEDYYCERKRLEKPCTEKEFDLLDVWEQQEFFDKEGEFDKSVFEAGLKEFIRKSSIL